MPDAYGNPTPEELMAMRAQQMRSASAQSGGGFRNAMTAGMQGQEGFAPTSDPRTQDFSAQERKIKSQRAMADQMRGRGAPKGREVGPLGVYMGPNIGESIAHAADQFGGAYLSRKADEADEGLTKSREAKAAAILEDANEEKDYARSRDALGDKRYDSVEAKEEAIRLEANAYRDEQEAIRKAERAEDLREAKEKGLLDHEQKIELMELEAQLEEDGYASVGDYDEDTNRAVSSLPSAGERKTARMLLNTSEQLQGLTTQAELLLENNPDANWSSGKADVAADIATDFPIIGGDALRNVVKGVSYDDDETDVRGVAANAVESFRRARTGANLTGVEIKVGEDWDPTAPGIGPQESLRRTIKLNEVVNDYLGNMGVPSPKAKSRNDLTPRDSDPEDIPVIEVKAVTDMTPQELEEELARGES